MTADTTTPPRTRRFRLYLPFGLLAVAALAWTVAWFVIRGRVEAGLNDWIAAEATVGRRWACADRRIGGYPFRIEIGCATLRLERRDLAAELGPVLVVTQVYRPSHLIAEAAGPLQVQSAGGAVTATWRLLQASVNTKAGEERAAIVTDGPTVRAERPGAEPVEARAARTEIHARPAPADRTTADVAFSATGATVPGLDPLVGGTEPADLDLRLAVSRAYDLPGRPNWSELERWRLAGGDATLVRFAIRKGPRRLEASGAARLDDAHRPAGEFRVAADGLEGLLGRFTGGAGLAGGLLGALLGAAPPPAGVPPATGGPALKPLPPLALRDGRVFLGPIAIPSVRLPALY